MCGIIGVTGSEKETLLAKGLAIMKNRGSDNSSSWSDEYVSFGHNLHSIVGYVAQPLENERFVFACNSEIYNWKQLAQDHNLEPLNDAEVLFLLLQQKSILEVLDMLDGVYAFFLYDKVSKKVILARDILGVKPLFFSQDVFSFASEKKSLPYTDIRELSPRSILEYDFGSKEITFIERPFFSIEPELKSSKEEILQELETKFVDAILKRVPDAKLGVLFSGGIDSTIIAYILMKHNIPFTCYTAAVSDFGDDAPDLLMAQKIAEQYGLNLSIASCTLDELEGYISTVAPLIESNNVVKVGVALPFYLACEKAHADGCRVILSGLGSEEIFAGYERHAVSAGIGGVDAKGDDASGAVKHASVAEKYDSLTLGNVNKECLSGLYQIHERDLYRDDVVTMYNHIELRLPFLDKALVDFALKIPSHFKINDIEKKLILREMSEKKGLDKEYAWRPKKAAQYGSKFDKAIAKLARKKGFSNKSEYLESFYKEKNLKLGALLSTGKDSLYATYILWKQNYSISCFMTMQSSNEDSFMFHTPNISLASYQADAACIPLIVQGTSGEKEKELDDLYELLKKAKTEYNIDGVITGALFSTYQRDRIEKVCDRLGLIVRNPLWHKNQEHYMYELLRNDFSFIMSKVMSEGLDSSWVGVPIKEHHIRNLVALNQKVGLNIAGEGGEYETLVLDCPLFKQKIVIKDSDILCDPERKETATFIPKEVQLEDKEL
ncbi:MAG: diphthine--ammonia ligase [Candidatus Woesearchaeota archaeon]